MKLGNTVCVALLALQAAAIVRARFTRSRYFAWAPYDEILEYEIFVSSTERGWTASEIEMRYRIPSRGRENRCAWHLFRTIERRERTSDCDDLHINVRYSLNGRPSARWSYRRKAES
jgi:hypothetical protein